jgi:hypothetical protein
MDRSGGSGFIDVVGRWLGVLCAALAVAGLCTIATETEAADAATIWVDPSRGGDSGPGTRERPLRSLSEAWGRLPAVATEPMRIELRAGDYRGLSPVYWEEHSGRTGSPILIRSTDGRGRARLPGVNIYGVSHLSFSGVRFADGGDVIHCERCENFTLDRVIAFGRGAQETVKVNQSRGIRITNSTIGGAGDNAIDFVAVQDGLIRGNLVHRAGDWCAYAKGGSVNIVVTGNHFTRCGTGGFSAGQGTGFQFMERPWLHHEAVGMLIQGNTVTETEGAAFAVQGGFNVLVRNNVARRVGSRSHVLEALYGSRSCDGRPGDDGRTRCDQYLAEGGWGTTVIDDGSNYVRIGNRHVYFVGNAIYNPWPFRSAWQHLEVQGPFGPQPGTNVPEANATDSDLRFQGNVIWNGRRDMPIGVGSGCAPSNPTCNESQLTRDNLFNRRQPVLRRSGIGLVKAGWTASYRRGSTPAPDWTGLPAGDAPWSSWPSADGRVR